MVCINPHPGATWSSSFQNLYLPDYFGADTDYSNYLFGHLSLSSCGKGMFSSGLNYPYIS